MVVDENRRRVEAEETPLTPQSYPLATLAALWENLPQVLAAGLGFSLFAVPTWLLLVFGLPWLALIVALVGVAPAWTAMLRFLGRRAAGWSDGLTTLPGTFRRVWQRSVQLGLAGLALPALLLAAAHRLELAAPALAGLAAVTLLPAALASSIVLLYACPLAGLYDQGAATALRNAAVLSARYIANTLGLVALAVLLTLATVQFSLGLIFLWPAVLGLFAANNCRLVVTLEQQP